MNQVTMKDINEESKQWLLLVNRVNIWNLSDLIGKCPLKTHFSVTAISTKCFGTA